MSEIEFLTDLVLFKWAEQQDLKKYSSRSISSASIQKIPLLFIQQNILFDDQTGVVVTESYHSISFILLILLNLVYTDEILVKLIQN